MNEKLKIWLEDNKELFSENGIKTISKYENENSLVVQHETDLYIGEISANNDGFTDTEIIEIKSGELVFCMHCNAHADIEISPMLDMYMNFIKRRL